MIKDLRSKGMPKFETTEAGWNAMEAKFPPEQPLEPIPPPVPDTAGAYETQKWWRDVPTEGNYEADVKWAYEQMGLVVVERSGQQPRLFWDRATEAPPSRAAETWLGFAATNKAKFLGEIVPKAFNKSDRATDEEEIKQEEKTIEQLREVLRKLRDDP